MVASNADDYAAARQNVFFPGQIPSLDGQCVSLVKGFLQDMTTTPNPQAARGDAKDVGRTLVAQGLAREVPYGERRRGDVITNEYDPYGHIYVQLSGGRVFEENVNVPGVASKIVAGARVYASRIGSETESWRRNIHVYRINGYNEQVQGGDEIMNRGDVFNCFFNLEHRVPTEADYAAWTGQPIKKYLDQRGFGAVKDTQLTKGDVINIYYHLGVTQPDADAQNFWEGHSAKELFYAIINSQEYINKHK